MNLTHTKAYERFQPALVVWNWATHCVTDDKPELLSRKQAVWLRDADTVQVYLSFGTTWSTKPVEVLEVRGDPTLDSARAALRDYLAEYGIEVAR